MNYVVYIIYSNKFDKYYTGHTNNIERRLIEHNSAKAGYTKYYQPWVLVYEQRFNNRTEAMALEKYIKSLKNKSRIKAYIAGWRSSTSRGS
ncbi:MAG: GIY-YIG nuclease family protein [Patescibacteria group bacterium]